MEPRFDISDVGLLSSPLLPSLSSSPSLGVFSPHYSVHILPAENNPSRAPVSVASQDGCPSGLAICGLARVVHAPCGHFWTEPSTLECLETAGLLCDSDWQMFAGQLRGRYWGQEDE